MTDITQIRPTLLEVDLQAGYGSQTVLHQVSFELQAGRSLGIVGSSGAGKSTLVLALLGLLPWRGGWAKGHVRLDGVNLLGLPDAAARTLRGRRLALIPQSPLSALNAAVSLRSHFEHAWRAHESSGRAALDTRLETLLAQVQLPGDRQFLARRPGSISVGQAQRILIALALLHRPALIIADEPTSALDPVTQAEIVKLLQTLSRNHGTALVYISHDLVSVLQLCDEIAILDRGVIAEHIPISEIGRAGHHPSLTALLDALPVPPAVLLNFCKLP